MRFFLFFAFILSTTGAQAENTSPLSEQERIPLLSVITEIPDTAWASIKYSFNRDAIPAWATIIGSTAILYHYDDDIYSGTKTNGLRWGIGNNDHTKTIVKAFGFDLLRVPSDAGSFMYFLGDGWMHTAIAVGFVADGYLAGNNRAYNTGLEMIHGMVTSTIFSQAIKRATGRQSPNNATEPKGEWRPFPSIAAYQAHTAAYDAFPSGHIMTAALAFTVINENYPEYFYYVMPAEVLWLTALGFEMVNNGVHWASDYPLGIGIGYAVGKMSTRLVKKPAQAFHKESFMDQVSFFPSPGPYGPELNALYYF